MLLPGEFVILTKQEAIALRDALDHLNQQQDGNAFFRKLRELGVLDFHGRVLEMERQGQSGEP